MKLKILGSSSKGNCYIFDNGSDALVLEAGVNIKDIKQAMNFEIGRIFGCLCSHEHLDHAKYMKDFMAAGIDVYASGGTIGARGLTGHRVKTMVAEKTYNIGPFKVMPFLVEHDAAEPFGFLLFHPDMGKTLFLTDSYYSPHTFNGLNNIIVEANYSQEILDGKMSDGRIHGFVRNRVLTSHMSIDTCVDLLKANDLSAVNNVLLVHLSDSNSDAVAFKRRISDATGKLVTIAEPGMTISLTKTPF